EIGASVAIEVTGGDRGGADAVGGQEAGGGGLESPFAVAEVEAVVEERVAFLVGFDTAGAHVEIGVAVGVGIEEEGAGVIGRGGIGPGLAGGAGEGAVGGGEVEGAGLAAGAADEEIGAAVAVDIGGGEGRGGLAEAAREET